MKLFLRREKCLNVLWKYKLGIFKSLKKLRIFLDYLKNNPIVLEDKGYLVPFHSFNYEIGDQLYKKHNLKEAERLRKKKISKQFVSDIQEVSCLLNKEIIVYGECLEESIARRLKK